MFDEKCYGILEDPDLIYGENCFNDLKSCIKEALRSGATSFMVADIGYLNNRAYKICKNFQRNRKNPFKIKIISTKIKNQEVLKYYKNDDVIFVYSEAPYLYELNIYKINQFIVNNSFKCFGFLEDTEYFNKLTTEQFIIITPNNCKEINFEPKDKILYDNEIDITNIEIMD